ncbi:MAG: histone deacetylase [Candidatus Omnitrophica bacterium]|nr:histone deacetylase [Candidatus Omnitrophota bacterium]MCM8797910.1 histone deacetylase [Candidatus Omnitrophota bacterium]
MLSQFKFFYSPHYEVDLGPHIFPTLKYRLIKIFLTEELSLKEENFISPGRAEKETVCLVHTGEYFDKLKNSRLSLEELIRLEIPMDEKIFVASLICVEGTYLASRFAWENGLGIHIGGGFHHAFPDHGEGFCVFNDIAIAIKRLQKEKLIKKAMVIDCDLHQGNGTAFIFQKDKNVFTFSIHQENNYPFHKPPSSLDIGLEDGASDVEYLEELQKNIPRIINDFKPDFILYQAGADPYEKDQLGGLKLTKEGLKERDRFIFTQAKENRIPIAVTLGGGYAFDIKDTVEIHCNTILEALKIMGGKD